MRLLRRSPGFAIVAILTIAVGVGANVAIYSVIDAVLINPLPYEDPERLVFIWGIEGGLKSGSNWNSYPDVVDFQERAEVFEEIGSFSARRVTLTGNDREPLRVAAGHVSHDLLEVIGVRPVEGRGILPKEDEIGGDPVVLIGSGLRHELFGDGDALGNTLTIDGMEHTVVGVMPSWFTLPSSRSRTMSGDWLKQLADNARDIWEWAYMAWVGTGTGTGTIWRIRFRDKPATSGASVRFSCKMCSDQFHFVKPFWASWLEGVVSLACLHVRILGRWSSA